jgi:membrane protease YdiL (CAAX protease family)
MPWPVSPTDFLACALFVVGSAFLFMLLTDTVVNLLSHRMPLSGDTHAIVNNIAMEIGALAGAMGARAYLRFQQGLAAGPGRSEAAQIQIEQPPRAAALSWPLAGMLTFLAALPAVALSMIAWSQIAHFLRLPLEPQETIELLIRLKSLSQIIAFFGLATVGAPMVEELVFRAGLFRYLRTRIPRWAALTLPALVFAALHVEWRTLNGLGSFAPLLVLAIIFSLAYERTGHIGVTMVAHALFNLNMILLALAGISN